MEPTQNETEVAREEAQRIAQGLFRRIAERAGVNWTEADDREASGFVSALLEANREMWLNALKQSMAESENKLKDSMARYENRTK